MLTEQLQEFTSYIWWQTPEESLQQPEHLMAYVMNMGTYSDVRKLLAIVEKSVLRTVLKYATPGWFNHRSWSFWHNRLFNMQAGDIPPLPVRKVPQPPLSERDKYYQADFSGNYKKKPSGRKKMSNVFWDILPSEQYALWPELRQLFSLGLVLYGGTAIALQLGHRQSVDFDFFTNRPLDKKTILALPFLEGAAVLQDSMDTLSFRTAEGVKLSFFGGINFGRITSPTKIDGVWVASLDDLLATKLKTLFDRLEVKDYRDIAAILRAGYDLSCGLACGESLFGRAFVSLEAMKILTWFNERELDTLTQEDRETLMTAVHGVEEIPAPPEKEEELAGGDDGEKCSFSPC